VTSLGGDYELEYRHITKLYKRHPEYFSAEFTELGKLKRIGSGGFGTVYKSVYRGDVVAVKRLYADTPRVYKYLVREIGNLRVLSHPNILKFYAVCHRNFRELYMITDLVDGGSLDKVLKKLKGNYGLIIDILIYVARGMSYLADIGMLHRDLKLGNVLISKDFLTVKLCDFGLSRFTNEPDPDPSEAQSEKKTTPDPSERAAQSEKKTTPTTDKKPSEKRSLPSDKKSPADKKAPPRPMLGDGPRKMTVVGTLHYMAPELGQMRGGTIDSKLDVYSFGVMITELLGAPPKRKEAFDINYFEKKRDKKALPELVELVYACTQDNSRKRPSFRKIIVLLESARSVNFPNAVPLVPDTSRSKRASQLKQTPPTETPATDNLKSSGVPDGGPPPDPAPPPPIPAPNPPTEANSHRLSTRRRSNSVGDLFDEVVPVPELSPAGPSKNRKRGQVVYFNPTEIQRNTVVGIDPILPSQPAS